MPARRHSTSQASSSESLVANSSLGNAATGAPSRSMMSPPECVSTAARISGQTKQYVNAEIVFPKRARQTVRGPVLFVARDPGAGTETTHQIGLGQNGSRGSIYF